MILGRRTELPFLFAARRRKGLASELRFARWDKYPVSEDRLLIIPNRHVADYFSLTAEEKTTDTITSTSTDLPKIGRYHHSAWGVRGVIPSKADYPRSG
jgi:hypothetical protein